METVGRVKLKLEHGLRFGVDFGADRLTTDASAPLGEARGPDSEQLLVAAVANCLAGSLVVSLRKYRNADVTVDVSAAATMGSNERGRQRLAGIDVDIRLGAVAAEFRFLDRALAQFEDFCVVTQSVRAAVPVKVRVFDAAGTQLTA